MSDTPRTDAAEAKAREWYEKARDVDWPPFDDSPFDFARQLERELAEAKAQLAVVTAGRDAARKDAEETKVLLHRVASGEEDSRLRRERDQLREEIAEISGCVDYGAISAGKATVLSEVQRTIAVLRECQHAKGQQKIELDILRDENERLNTQFENTLSATANSFHNINDTCRARGFSAGPSGKSTEDRVIALAQAYDKTKSALSKCVEALEELESHQSVIAEAKAALKGGERWTPR